MRLPLISIITPTYNHESFIGQCIESVLAQSYQDWEMLVIDDGSDDNTWEIIHNYASKDSRIHAFHQENKGIWRLAETYNFAFEKSKGELIAILEGDDFWPTTKLEVQTKWHIKNPNIVFSYGLYEHYHTNTGKYLKGQVPSKLGLLNGLEWFRLNAVWQSGILAVSVIINKEFLKNIGGFLTWADYPAVDLPTLLSLSRQEKAFVYVGDTIVGYWRHRKGQTTSEKGYIMAEKALEMTLCHFRSLSDIEKSHINLKEIEILKARSPGIADSYFIAIRQALLYRDKKRVLNLIPHLWKNGNFKRKLQAIYAYFACFLGLDMEFILSVYARLSALN